MEPYVAGAADHQQLEWLGGSTVSVLLDGASTGQALTALLSELSEGDAAPVHRHSREDEVFLLLSGSAVVWCGEQRYEIGAGSVAFLPRKIPHTYRITSNGTRMLTLCTPAGLEGFFRTAGHDVCRPKPAGWSLGPLQLAPAAEAHGVTLLGPPPAD